MSKIKFNKEINIIDSNGYEVTIDSLGFVENITPIIEDVLDCITRKGRISGYLDSKKLKELASTVCEACGYDTFKTFINDNNELGVLLETDPSVSVYYAVEGIIDIPYDIKGAYDKTLNKARKNEKSIIAKYHLERS